MRTFRKHVGQNYSAADHRDTAPGFHWAPLMGGRAFDRAESAREMAVNRRLDKAFALHIGQERIEVASTNPESKIFGIGRTVTPQDLDDEELATLLAQLDLQVREADANAHALADEAAADFESQKAAAIDELSDLLARVRPVDERLGLLKARSDIERALSEWKCRYFARSETLRDHRATDTLRLARDQVKAELGARRSAKAAKQAEVRAMLAEAGISF